MKNKQITLKKGFPKGVVFLEERLRPLVRKIYALDDEDIRELDAFLNYLIMGPDIFYKSENRYSSKTFDFMNGGMGKTG